MLLAITSGYVENLLTMNMSETETLSEPRSTLHQLALPFLVCAQPPFLNSVSELPSTALPATPDTPDTPKAVLLNVED